MSLKLLNGSCIRGAGQAVNERLEGLIGGSKDGEGITAGEGFHKLNQGEESGESFAPERVL